MRDAIYALGIGPVRGANSDSPSESSLANSGAIRSDGRKNPSVGFLPREGRKNPSAYYALVRSFSVAERFAERKRSVISDLTREGRFKRNKRPPHGDPPTGGERT